MTQDTTTGIAIPEDVMEAARLLAAPRHIAPRQQDFAIEIARAIMAERARCRAELFGDEEKPRYTTRRMRTEVAKAKAYARCEALEEAAKLAECHFDDRGNGRSGHPSEMDWSDGYRDATRGAAGAIRARAKIAMRDLR